MSYSIEIKNLTKIFYQIKSYRDILLHPLKRKTIAALQGISLEVKQGELFSLLGPAGAGKTTLIKILCHLILPTSGMALVNGFEVTTHGRQIRKSIGYVLGEERSFYWRLSGRQNLILFATLNNLFGEPARRRIDEIFEIIGLTAQADIMFKDYSAGQKQKLAIARGLLTDPSILFMDEPTKSLDPAAAQNLKEFIKRELSQQKGKTIFFATHNLAEAEELSDRIAIIDQGKIKICGSLSAIRNQIKTKCSYLIEAEKSTAFDVDKLEKALRLDQIACFIRPSSSENLIFEIELKNKNVKIGKIIKMMVESGAEIISCQEKELSLSKIFSDVIEQKKRTSLIFEL